MFTQNRTCTFAEIKCDLKSNCSKLFRLNNFRSIKGVDIYWCISLQLHGEMFLQSIILLNLNYKKNYFQGFEVTCTIHDITSDDMLESLAVTQLGVK